MKPRLRALLREPLIHFVLIGALLFGLDRAIGGEAPRTDARRIVVGPDVRAAIAERWAVAHGRAPTTEELEAQVADWTRTELLYRAGMERGLDRDDPRVRERVAAKMGYVLEAGIVVPEPTEADLRAWFEQHTDRWSREELHDFTHVFVEGDDADARTRAAELFERLRAGSEPNGLGETFSGGRRYRGRKIDDLARTFGDEFVVGLADQQQGIWQLRRSRFGQHVVRIDKHTPARAPDFETVEADVRKDWEAARRAEALERSMDELRARWNVVTP